MKVGIATYTIRTELEKDPYYSLEKIAEIGYRSIEFCNIGAEEFPESPGKFAIDPNAFKKKADSVGVKLIGSLVIPGYFLTNSIDDINAFYDNNVLMRRILSWNSSIGANHVVIGIGFYRTKDDVLKRCERYNVLGKMAREYGLELLYHNHYHEFTLFDEKTIYDLIMENTDSELLKIELDAYWAIRGANNPIEIMDRYGTRVKTLHMKDFPFNQARYIDSWTMRDQNIPVTPSDYMNIVRPEFFIEWGDGMLKIQEIIDKGNEKKVPLIFVEQDNTAFSSEFESIQRSMNNMRKYHGLEL